MWVWCLQGEERGTSEGWAESLNTRNQTGTESNSVLTMHDTSVHSLHPGWFQGRGGCGREGQGGTREQLTLSRGLLESHSYRTVALLGNHNLRINQTEISGISCKVIGNIMFVNIQSSNTL